MSDFLWKGGGEQIFESFAHVGAFLDVSKPSSGMYLSWRFKNVKHWYLFFTWCFEKHQEFLWQGEGGLIFEKNSCHGLSWRLKTVKWYVLCMSSSI